MFFFFPDNDEQEDKTKLSGNRGEWSEPYVLLKLLGDGRIYAANEKLEKLTHIYFPILNILRTEESNKINYSVNSTDKQIEIYFNDNLVNKISCSDFIEEAKYLYDEIIKNSDTTFSVNRTNAFLNKIGVVKLKASTEDKADIVMKVHDINTGFEPICGFSIKSRLGAPSTLINASEATNFIFEVSNLDSEQIQEINEINTKQKIIDRVQAIINKGGHLSFVKMNNNIYANNLMYIDTRMSELLAFALLYSYTNNISECEKVLQILKNKNPLNFPSDNFYEYKFKKLLSTAALGMMPSKPWSAVDEANGGYIIVCESGDVLAYYIYNRDSFEKYLLSNTKFERASTTKHKYATIYTENGKAFIKLNLQVRFIK